MKRILTIIAGILGVLVGLAFVFPAVAQWRNTGAMTGLSVALLLLGIALTIGGGGTAFCGFREKLR